MLVNKQQSVFKLNDNVAVIRLSEYDIFGNFRRIYFGICLYCGFVFGNCLYVFGANFRGFFTNFLIFMSFQRIFDGQAFFCSIGNGDFGRFNRCSAVGFLVGNGNLYLLGLFTSRVCGDKCTEESSRLFTVDPEGRIGASGSICFGSLRLHAFGKRHSG